MTGRIREETSRDGDALKCFNRRQRVRCRDGGRERRNEMQEEALDSR